jgi:hypothetical protein
MRYFCDFCGNVFSTDELEFIKSANMWLCINCQAKAVLPGHVLRMPVAASANLGVRVPFSRTIRLVIRRFLQERRYKSNGWVFSDIRKAYYLNLPALWEQMYLPIDVTDKTVLDVGAGQGESARFFLEHGATKIICIEPDPSATPNLAFNASKHKELECYFRCFQLSDLADFQYDFLKMDIEGYEEMLLDLPTPLSKSYAIEVHGLQLAEKFVKKGYTIHDNRFHCWLSHAAGGT